MHVRGHHPHGHELNAVEELPCEHGLVNDCAEEHEDARGCWHDEGWPPPPVVLVAEGQVGADDGDLGASDREAGAAKEEEPPKVNKLVQPNFLQQRKEEERE